MIPNLQNPDFKSNFDEQGALDRGGTKCSYLAKRICHLGEKNQGVDNLLLTSVFPHTRLSFVKIKSFTSPLRIIEFNQIIIQKFLTLSFSHLKLLHSYQNGEIRLDWHPHPFLRKTWWKILDYVIKDGSIIIETWRKTEYKIVEQYAAWIQKEHHLFAVNTAEGHQYNP